MNDPTATATALAVGLILLGCLTGGLQVLGLRRLAARAHVPSDERAYLRGRYRRRLLTAAVLIVTGAMIGGAYLSGMEERALQLGEHHDPAVAPDEAADKPGMTDAQKQFVRIWSVYWIVVVVLVFVLISLALVDATASRRYWLAQYRAIREDHQTKLRRDLAVYKQHMDQTRGGRFGNRLGGDAGGGGA
ncbi:hypothetical protein [Fimbriiglobus ruber]|uniref:Transmembrane protein n=1 Tax=Fimbriiglobus ruber TaxID=1908690 RepID=A0A225DH47_9BACT|nr:hypothetical protein [Fimbriiglobus ruber]OWK37868.1 hypothetical protein FRUB_06988 [Fimbriiglobus ruber]